MNLLPQINQNKSNLPAQQVQSLSFIKELVLVAESGDSIKIAKHDRSITMLNACTGITLKAACRESSEDLVITALVSQIIRTANFFNLSRPMSEDQAIETGYLLLDKYPYETIEDFVIMFNRAKTGKYGELYNRLDGQVIFSWMEKYLDEKAGYREKEHQKMKKIQEGINLAQDIEFTAKTVEGEPEKTKTVVEALKEAINFEGLKSNEKNYKDFKISYIQQCASLNLKKQ